MCYFTAAVGPKGYDYSKYAYVDEKENLCIQLQHVENLFIETQLPKNSLCLITDNACACSSVIGSGLKDYVEDLEAGQDQLKKRWWWSKERFKQRKEDWYQERMAERHEAQSWVDIIQKVLKSGPGYFGLLRYWGTGEFQKEEIKIKGTTEIHLKQVNEKFFRVIERDKLYLIFPD